MVLYELRCGALLSAGHVTIPTTHRTAVATAHEAAMARSTLLNTHLIKIPAAWIITVNCSDLHLSFSHCLLLKWLQNPSPRRMQLLILLHIRRGQAVCKEEATTS